MNPICNLLEHFVSLVRVRGQVRVVLLDRVVDERTNFLDLGDGERLARVLGQRNEIGFNLGRKGIVITDRFLFLKNKNENGLIQASFGLV